MEAGFANGNDMYISRHQKAGFPFSAKVNNKNPKQESQCFQVDSTGTVFTVTARFGFLCSCHVNRLSESGQREES